MRDGVPQRPCTPTCCRCAARRPSSRCPRRCRRGAPASRRTPGHPAAPAPGWARLCRRAPGRRRHGAGPRRAGRRRAASARSSRGRWRVGAAPAVGDAGEASGRARPRRRTRRAAAAPVRRRSHGVAQRGRERRSSRRAPGGEPSAAAAARTPERRLQLGDPGLHGGEAAHRAAPASGSRRCGAARRGRRARVARGVRRRRPGLPVALVQCADDARAVRARAGGQRLVDAAGCGREPARVGVGEPVPQAGAVVAGERGVVAARALGGRRREPGGDGVASGPGVGEGPRGPGPGRGPPPRGAASRSRSSGARRNRRLTAVPPRTRRERWRPVAPTSPRRPRTRRGPAGGRRRAGA